jgi:LmbE family N-acetylglucosaminyl deacetylase
VFLFEPHQPEQCDWKPNVLLDITPVWESKRAAIEWMAGQEHLWEYYTRVALQRGAQAARNSDKKSSTAKAMKQSSRTLWRTCHEHYLYRRATFGAGNRRWFRRYRCRHGT